MYGIIQNKKGKKTYLQGNQKNELQIQWLNQFVFLKESQTIKEVSFKKRELNK